MGLLDSVIGSLAGGQQPGGGGGQAELINAVIGMLTQGGGLGGLVSKMQQGGLGDIASSWVGTGQNLPIGADQLGSLLGRDQLGSLAGQLGMNQGDLMGQLSQMLPQIVDGLTPQGRIPEGDLAGMGGGMGDLAGMLGGLLGKR